MTKRALVLGSGGFGGIAWEVGVLQGLHDARSDVLHWDLVIGTSAGAFVGARLLGEGSLDALYAAQVGPVLKEDEARLAKAAGIGLVRALRLARRPGLSWVSRAWFAVIRLSALIRFLLRHGISEVRHLGPILRIRRAGADVSPAVLARLGSIALAARTQGEQAWLDYWDAALGPVVEWPAGRLLVTTLDIGDGSRMVFEATSHITLAQAVAASTAVPTLAAPITIRRRHYVDGGGGSQTNADLAQGYQEVLVIAPVDRGQLAGEVEALEASGAKVVVIRPGLAAAVALGSDLALLDLGRRRGSALAGRVDGRGVGSARGPARPDRGPTGSGTTLGDPESRRKPKERRER